MRIGFVGNTNNYPFRLARAIQALGHDVVFLVDRPRHEPRHRPESHYEDVPYPYPNWIREMPALSPLRNALYPWTLRSELSVLGACDGVILNGLALSLGTSIKRPIIGLLTGSDLDVFANPKLVDVLAAAPYRVERVFGNRFFREGMNLCKRFIFRRFIALQRAGIAKCSLVEYALPGLIPEGDALLRELGIDERRRACFMLTDINNLPPSRGRADGVFRVFCATRLQLKRSTVGARISALDGKGTDVMLEGLRMFVSRAQRSVNIHLISFGSDADAVERQVKDMGLGDYVSWHPELSQREFLAELAQADVVLENFGSDSCIGMAGRDAMAIEKPVVAWGKSAVFERALGETLPIYEAKTASEIAAHLDRIVNNPVEVAAYSARGRQFAMRWFSVRKAAERCIEVFQQCRRTDP